jgi:hypothetical protein
MPQDCLDRLRVFADECHPGTTGMPQAVEVEPFTLIVHIRQKRAGFPLAEATITAGGGPWSVIFSRRTLQSRRSGFVATIFP